MPTINSIFLCRIYGLLDARASCKTVPNLTREQLELCYRASDVTLAAIEGLEHAVRECQHQVIMVDANWLNIDSIYLSALPVCSSSDGIDGTARRSAPKVAIHTHQTFSSEVSPRHSTPESRIRNANCSIIAIDSNRLKSVQRDFKDILL